MGVTTLPDLVVTAKAPSSTGNALNDPKTSQTAARSPRVRVLKDGKALEGLISVEVESNNYYTTDHFTLEFAAKSGSPPDWWDVDDPAILDIQFVLDEGSDWVSLIIGEVDHLTMHQQTGLLMMQGRDLSARLIETKTQEAFVNQTSSQVAETIAGRHSEIKGTNITPTSTLVGRYYEADHVDGSLDQFARTTTEWDLLVYLAQREGFDVFMTGTTLNFVPTVLPDSDPYVILWTPTLPDQPVPRMNAVSLRMERSLTLAKDIEVWVRSWNSQQARAFTKKSRAAGAKAASAAGVSSGGKPTTTQRYIFVRPNLTEEEAQKMANQLAIDLTKHERVVVAELPGELTLTPRNMVRLEGTGTSFDQSYYVEHIERRISFQDGFRQNVRMKNSSPRSQVQVT